mmetsp:Transcript_92413/g.288057  ORF Transcript_92413/g.288057 Transcript_92413/m.288057 type:complete len:193 (+) Transcript_92413:71-649(+)
MAGDASADADSQLPVAPDIGGRRRKRVISLVELLAVEEDGVAAQGKRRRVEEELPASSAASAAGALLLGDDVRLRSGLGVEAGLDGLRSRAEEVARDVRAALPHVFGPGAREAYEDRTGHFCSMASGPQARALEARLRELVPHVFGGRTGRCVDVADAAAFDRWCSRTRSRLDEAAAVAAKALGSSSSEDEL